MSNIVQKALCWLQSCQGTGCRLYANAMRCPHLLNDCDICRLGLFSYCLHERYCKCYLMQSLLYDDDTRLYTLPDYWVITSQLQSDYDRQEIEQYVRVDNCLVSPSSHARYLGIYFGANTDCNFHIASTVRKHPGKLEF